MQIYPDVFQIHQMFVNLYLVMGEGGPLLIDTGLKGSRRRILQALQQSGHSLAELQSILITHADGDHYGGLADLQRDCRAVVYASPIEAQAIRAGAASRPLNPRGPMKMLFGLVAPLVRSQAGRVDAGLVDGQQFNALGGLRAISTPGHTPGHMSFYSPSTGILFAGDSIRVVGGRPLPSEDGNTWDAARAVESFQRQIELNPRLILAGHGTWQAK